LFSDQEYFDLFAVAYRAIVKHSKVGPWYVEVHPQSGGMILPYFGTLQGYWPGLQVGLGHLEDAIRSMHAFMSIWRDNGFSPEGYNLVSARVAQGREPYPLRPELVESLYHLYVATEDPMWLEYVADIEHSIRTYTKTKCGYANIRNVSSRATEDKMESFFLSETLKYAYLVMDWATNKSSIVHQHDDYIFSTEGHPFSIADVAEGRRFAVGNASALDMEKALWRLPSMGVLLSGEGLHFVPPLKKRAEKAYHVATTVVEENGASDSPSIMDKILKRLAEMEDQDNSGTCPLPNRPTN